MSNEYQKYADQLIEQNIKIQATIGAGDTEYVSITIPANAKVFLKGYGYSYYTQTKTKLKAGKTSFPNREDQEGSPSIPMIYGNPIMINSGDSVTLKITNDDSASHIYDVVFYILTSRVIEHTSTGGELVLATSATGSGAATNVSLYNSAFSAAVDVTAIGGKNALNTHSFIGDGATNLEIATNGAARKTKSIQIMADDGTLTRNLQSDTAGNLKTIEQSQTQTAAHTAVDVGTSSTAVLAANASRKAALIINDSDSTIYLSITGAAAANTGIRLNANGGSFLLTFKEGTLTTGAITGITAAGSKKVLITEYT